MTWSDVPDGTGGSLTESLFVSSLPAVPCTACGDQINRREHRVMLRASWRPAQENLCSECWTVITQWAARFALQQMHLPGI